MQLLTVDQSRSIRKISHPVSCRNGHNLQPVPTFNLPDTPKPQQAGSAAGEKGKGHKILRLMKLTAIILLSACLAASAEGNTQGISLSGKNLTLEQVFKSIEQQSDYIFFYPYSSLKDARKITVNIKNGTINQVLEACFKNQPFTYVIKDKTIVISSRVEEKSPNQSPIQKNQPPSPIDISGRVTDEDGNPLEGATVKVKGTNITTTTNSNGEFQLTGIPDNATLEISYVGYQTLNVPVNGKTSLVTALKTDVQSMNEVVINKGYYTEKQKLSVSNVGRVTSKEIEKQPVNNPLLALQGRIAGVFITQSTGIPGGGVTLRIQGQTSLQRGSDPLYVIDGMPYNSQNLPNISGTFGILGGNGNNNAGPSGGGNPLAFINPDDIESITILKDADATSIYGSRASAGAVLITTKKGKAGKTKVDVSFQSGFGKVPRTLTLLNSSQYLQMRHEAKINSASNVLATDYDLNGTWDTTRYTDWQKVLLGGTAKYYDASVSVSGGNNYTQFLFSSGYHKETSVFPGDLNDQKASVNFNINHSSTNQKFKLSFSGNYLVDDNRLINNDLTRYAVGLAPVAPALRNPDGSLNWAPLANGNSSWFNPLAFLERKYSIKTNNLVGNALISYQLMPGLLLKSNFGYLNRTMEEVMLMPLTSFAPERRPTTSRSTSFANGTLRSWIAEPQLEYKRDIKEGSLDAMIGVSFLDNKNQMQLLSASGFNSDKVMEDIRSATTISVLQSLVSEYKYNAIYGRVNYDWKKTYLINLTGRRDGSSRFGSNNLFHNFWSAGAGWIFTNEKFMQNHSSILNFGKLRFSYGTSGNDQIGDYQFLSLYNPAFAPTPYQGSPGITPAGLPNPYLQWEETRKLQFGLDIGLMQDRITATFNYYHNRSSNQLQLYILPFTTGFGSLQQNLEALIQNTGWEISVNAVNIKKKHFNWTTSINLTLPKNKLVSYPGIENTSNATRYILGEPFQNTVPSFQYAGIDPNTGLFLFFDKNGNKTSTPVFEADLIAYQVGGPTAYGGLINNIRYKGFELDFLFQFVKQQGYNYQAGNSPGGFTSNNTGTVRANQPYYVFDHWKKTGDNTNFQRFYSLPIPTPSTPAGAVDPYTAYTLSDQVFSDASFVRLKNLSLSWQVPAKLNKTLHLQSARLFILGQNIFAITNDYIGLDPETQTVNSLPPLKIWTAGIKVSL
jgi:TonB-linked SusC/RagA family outer membrane protein